MIKLFLLCIILLCLDFIYISLIKDIFIKQIYDVQKSELQINLTGVILCYLLLVIGLNYFIIEPNKNIYEAFLLGLIVYGVYETTNYALLKDWSINIVIIDTLWGGILFVLTKIFYTIIIDNFIIN